MKIIWVILFFIPFIGYTQTQEKVVYSTLDSIISRGLMYGVNLEPLLEAHLDTIVLWEPHQFPKPKDDRLSEVFATAHYLGVKKGKWYWEIRISNELLNDLKILERVIAHEVGHVIGLKHCCVKGSDCYDDFVCLEIMGVGHITDEDKHPFFYNEQWKERYWENYFTLIKSNNTY